MSSPPPDAGVDASTATEQTFRLDLSPEPSMVMTARLFASGIARLAGCDEARVEEIKLAVSEACTVALDPAPQRITLQAARTAAALTFAVAPAKVPAGHGSGGDGDALPTGMRLIGLIFDDAGPGELEGQPAIAFTVPLSASERPEA